jgi:chromosome segregation ATPase
MVADHEMDRFRERLSTHGESIARIDTRVNTVESEVRSLRESRDKVNDTIQAHIEKLRFLNERIGDLEGENAQHGELLVRADLPTMRERLEDVLAWRANFKGSQSVKDAGTSRLITVVLTVTGSLLTAAALWMVTQLVK